MLEKIDLKMKEIAYLHKIHDFVPRMITALFLYDMDNPPTLIVTPFNSLSS